MSDKKEAAKKPATTGEKKKRVGGTRKPLREYKKTAAGHFADKFTSYAGTVEKALKRVAKYPLTKESLDGATNAITYLRGLSGELDELSKTDWKPTSGRGGGRGFTAVPSMRVYIKAEGAALLAKQGVATATELAKNPLFVSFSMDETNKKQIPVRMGGPKPSDRWLGFLSKNWFSNKPIEA